MQCHHLFRLLVAARGFIQGSSTSSNSVKAPDTGYGTPNNSNLVIAGLSVVAVMAIAGGVSLLYRQKRKSQSYKI